MIKRSPLIAYWVMDIEKEAAEKLKISISTTENNFRPRWKGDLTFEDITLRLIETSLECEEMKRIYIGLRGFGKYPRRLMGLLEYDVYNRYNEISFLKHKKYRTG